MTSNQTFTVTLLRKFDARLDGLPVKMDLRIRRFLTLLLLYPNQHNRRTLAEYLWPNDEDEHLVDLRGIIFQLRRALHETRQTQLRVVGTDSLHFELQSGDQVDIFALEQTQQFDTAKLDDLLELAKRYGPPDDEIADLFSVSRRERLSHCYDLLLSTIGTRYIDRGDGRAALMWARKRVEHDSQNEDAYIAQMQAYALLGDEDGVMATLELCERNKDMPASAKLRKAHDRYAALARDEMERGAKAPNNLPHYDRPLVGRHDLLEQLSAALSASSDAMISVVGMGGIGKTRLAVEVANRALRVFSDGVFFVQLDGVLDLGNFIFQMASAMGFHFYSGDPAEVQLRNRLENKHILFVLDGMEQVFAQDPKRTAIIWLDHLIDAAPRLKFLITSRQRLLSPHERVVDLSGLSVPTDALSPDAHKAESVELFQHLSKRRFNEDLQLEEVVEICKLVQGLPLAIELAAAWTRAMTCAQIAQGIRNELRLLSQVAGPQGAPQPSNLRASFEYSWKQLAEYERELFMKLCVFERGSTYEAAEAVADANGSGLLGLVDKSFLQRDTRGRYLVHALLRQYGGEKLRDPARAQTRLLAEQKLVDYFLQFSTEQITSGHPGFDGFAPEWANVLQAIRLASAHQNWQVVLQMVACLTEPWYSRSRFSDALAGHQLATQAATEVNQRPSLLKSLRWQGRMLLEQGDYDLAQTCYARALELAMDTEDEVEIAWVYHDQAWCAIEQSRGKDADDLLAKSISIFEEYGHAEELPPVYILCARRCIESGNLVKAAEFAERARSLLEPLGNSYDLAHAYRWISEAAQRREDWPLAKTSIDRALQISLAVKSEFTLAACFYTQARLAYLSEDDSAMGLRAALEARRLFTNLGAKKPAALALYWSGMLHLRLGENKKAYQRVADSLAQLEKLGEKFPVVNVKMHLGDVLVSLGRAHEAQPLWREALALAQEIEHPLAGQLEQRCKDVVGAA